MNSRVSGQCLYTLYVLETVTRGCTDRFHLNRVAHVCIHYMY